MTPTHLDRITLKLLISSFEFKKNNNKESVLIVYLHKFYLSVWMHCFLNTANLRCFFCPTLFLKFFRNFYMYVCVSVFLHTSTLTHKYCLRWHGPMYDTIEIVLCRLKFKKINSFLCWSRKQRVGRLYL